MTGILLSMPRSIRSRGYVRCDWCGRQIDAGETYCGSAHVYDGRAYTWRECAHCRALIVTTTLYAHLWDLPEEGLGGAERIAEWEPADRREAVLKSRWSRGWRSWDGDERGGGYWRPADTNPLLPVPPREES